MDLRTDRVAVEINLTILEDEWTAITRDGQLSAQFEHTLVVTKKGCEVLTKRPGPLANSERFPGIFS